MHFFSQAVARETNRCFWLHLGVLLGVHPMALQASCRDRCAALSAKIADLDARDAFEDCQFFSEPIRSVLRRRGAVNSAGVVREQLRGRAVPMRVLATGDGQRASDHHRLRGRLDQHA